MRANVVFTLTGTDRIGIVEEVTQLFLDLGGNVEASRMARLGGEFAILMLVTLSSDQLAGVDQAVAHLVAEGFKVTTQATEPVQSHAHAGWSSFQIKVEGADHEGIVHEVSRFLSQRGINIESIDAGTSRAPITGTSLFTMTALVAVPPHLANQEWQAALLQVGHSLNVDIHIAPAPTQP